VTPSLVKYTVDSLEDSGKTVGMLGAFNTIGSIIGTFLPTFVTIPAVGTSVTFLIFAGILLALACCYFISSKINPVKTAAGAGMFILCCVLGCSDSFAFWEDSLTFEGESIYNYLQVKEEDNRVILSTNVLFGVQSVYIKDGGLTGMYYDYAMAAPFMAGVNEKESMKVLILGMGTGTFATQCENYFTNLSIEGVEIDGDITRLAVEYFHLPEDIPVYTYDGRAYLNAVEEKYDVIMVDAYQDITIPFQMSSTEFFTLVSEHLTDDGIMVVNMNMRGETEGNINQYLADTISAVFTEVYTVDVAGSTNRELFASDSPDMLKVFAENVSLEENEKLAAMMQRVEAGMSEYTAGEYIMTDDKAPVELLGMQIIDGLIAEEVDYYKEIYREKGISGLLNSVL
ncbi:MAG: fused MFS/spermidine synthase, partial [Lachnospiraceae bacterium]|nr:fused MFS/spermidine synthase [Lachnospiraceae bacterium]